MRFDKVLVVGSGKIACDCVRYLIKEIEKNSLLVVESQENKLSMLNKVCKTAGIEYIMITDKMHIDTLLLEETRDFATLIISANNRYIFTSEIIDRKNVEIINFHYALLPRYRGMNIPTWVIYNEEQETGITWHFVTTQVDFGKIIDQRKIPINSSTTALDITKQGMTLALDSFKSFIGKLLEEKIEGQNVSYPVEDKIYYNSMLPMNGVLDLNQSLDQIIRLLRSFDYGRTQVVPYLKIQYLNNQYWVVSYKINENVLYTSRKIIFEELTLTICEASTKIILTLKK